MLKITIIICLVALTTALPQWPYRDNQEYYGYQRNNYRSVSGEDDETESYQGRQDLKVGGTQVQTAVQPSVPVVVETGSAKPVLNAAVDNKAVVAPVVETVPATNNKQPPAFPPATPPSPPSPVEEDSEEDSDEDEEADEDDVEEEDEENEARSEPVKEKPVVKATEPEKTKKPTKPKQTVEALVPGYVTDEGEVLVPFDTVVNDKKDVVAVIEDPSYSKSSPPVVVMKQPEVDRPVPKFFNPAVNRQLYYSDVPPPGSIFTFDDDLEDNSIRARAAESSEEAEDDEDVENSDESNDASEEEAKSPPLAYIKATSPSGEDDEADSLGIRPIARMGFVDSRYYDFYPDRSPNYYYGNNYYENRDYNRYAENRYDSYKSPVYYYRPASTEKVKVVPLGSFDVSLEHSEENVRAVVSPFRPHRRVAHVRPQSVVRRPVPRRPTKIYGTPVVRGRGTRRERELKKKVLKKEVVREKKVFGKKQ